MVTDSGEVRSKRLMQLRKLTDSLPPEVTIHPETTTAACIDFGKKPGGLYAVGLLKSETIAICKCYGVTGEECGVHVHDKEDEYILVIKGHVVVNVPDGEDLIVKEGGLAKVDRGIGHGLKIIEDSETVIITVPGSPLYPEQSEGRE